MICLQLSVILFTSSSSASGSTMKRISYCLNASKFILLVDVQPHRIDEARRLLANLEPMLLLSSLWLAVVNRHCFQDAIADDCAQRHGASFKNLFKFSARRLR